MTMPDTLKPQDLTAEERALVDNCALFYRRTAGDNGETAEWCYVQGLEEAEPIILARRALFAPAPEKAAKAATTADRIAADLAAGTFRGVKPEPEEVTCMNCRQRVDYADQHYHREDMPHVAAYFICDKPAPPEPAESVDTAKTVAYNNELDERYGDGTLARAMELSGLSIPTTPLAVEREEERQAAGEWWRNLAQPVAVGMTEELSDVLAVAEEATRREPNHPQYQRSLRSIAAVRQQAAQGQRPKLEKVRGALSWLKMQYEPGSQGYTPNATVWKMTEAALAELDAAQAVPVPPVEAIRRRNKRHDHDCRDFQDREEIDRWLEAMERGK